jgi:hypothetical protein
MATTGTKRESIEALLDRARRIAIDADASAVVVKYDDGGVHVRIADTEVHGSLLENTLHAAIAPARVAADKRRQSATVISIRIEKARRAS